MWNLFYRNPRLLALTIGLVVVVGLTSYQIMPRLEDPTIVNRFATVTTRFPGASAERVESLVTERLEEEIREVEEIKLVESSSAAGISLITIELLEDVDAADVAEVWSRVRNKIDDASPELASGAAEPEFETPDFKAYALIAALKWTQDEEPNYSILRRRAEELQEAIRAIPGTEKVELFGDPDEEIVVEVRPADLAALGLTAAEVSRQVRASDSKVAAGQWRGSSDNLLLEIDGELDSLERIARIPIQHGPDGRFVRLSDIGEVKKGIVEPPRDMALIDGRPAVALGVMVQPNRRIDHWNRRAADVLAQYDETLPPGVELKTVFEQNLYVTERLEGLQASLFIGAVGVVVVMLAMMGWRSALVVGAALPLTTMMVLAGLRLFGIPIHQMSVTGLVIALGLLIDNAIVMVDDVRHRLAEGGLPGESVARSVRHLAVPLGGSTLTTALAFAPLALLPGAPGEFVGSIAVSVILAVFSSFLLSMTVIPALSALGWRAGPSTRRGHWWATGISSTKLTGWYRQSLGRVFAKPLVGVGIGLVLPVAGFLAFGSLTEQFFPPSDRDQCRIELQLPSQSSLAETLATVKRARKLALRHPQVESIDWFLGRSAPAFYYNLIGNREDSAYYAEGLVQLKSAHGSREVIRQLQAELDSALTASRALVLQLEQGPPFAAPVEVRLYGPDVDQLRGEGERLRAILSQVPHVIHTAASLGEAMPKLSLLVDEEQARLAGLDPTAAARQLNATLEGSVGGSVLEATEELPVRIRVSNADRADLSRIASLSLLPGSKVAGGEDGHVPLGALASIDLVPELATIARRDGQRVNVVQGYITAGVLPAEVLAALKGKLADTGFELPPGCRLEYGGEAAERDEAVANLTASVGPLFVLMVASLVLSFGSFRMAGLIAAVGGLSVGLAGGMLWLFGYPFGFMAIVGTMGLVGVAINDSIVVLAALRESPRAKQGDPEAVRDVVVRSTRHVVATSLTTMAGFTPLVLGGGGLWPPLAVTIAGGVAGATLLALYFTPSAYLLIMCRGRCAALAQKPAESLAKEKRLPAAGRQRAELETVSV
jgi:multidrug efflux pump subunit AcrB